MTVNKKLKTTLLEFKTNNGEIIIYPTNTVRQDWEEQFKQMAATGDAQLLDDDFPLTVWEIEEWVW
jgi:hypothetical protein